MSRLNSISLTEINVESEAQVVDENKHLVKKELKEKLYEHMETTPIHGIPNIVRSKFWYMKLFWILFFTLFACFGAWLIAKALFDFFEYPVVTEIERVIESQPEFPAVTICNLDALQTKHAADYMDKMLFQLYEIQRKDLRNEPTPQVHAKLVGIRKLVLNELSNPSVDDKTKQKFGYTLEETLIDCHYNNENCMHRVHEDFNWYYSYKYGNCFTFNSGLAYRSRMANHVKSVSKPGIRFGLRLELFAGIAHDSLYSTKKFGAIMFIHNQTSKPEGATGILLKPGTQTNVEVKKSFNSLLASPYSPCQDLDTFEFDRSLYNVLNEHMLAYTQQDCLDLCMQQEIISLCGCYYLHFFQLNNSRPCLTLKELTCAKNSYEKFTEKDTVNTCQSKCPLECDSLKYKLAVSSTGFPTDDYAYELKDNDMIKAHYAEAKVSVDKAHLENDILALNVYVNDFSYMATTHSRKISDVDIFSSVGATLTICIGLSLTSVVQVFDMAISMIMIVVKHFRRHD